MLITLGKGGRLLGNQQIPVSRKPFVTSLSPLAHGRGGAGEVRTSLQEHWRVQVSPAVQTMLGTALSLVGGNGICCQGVSVQGKLD